MYVYCSRAPSVVSWTLLSVVKAGSLIYNDKNYQIICNLVTLSSPSRRLPWAMMLIVVFIQHVKNVYMLICYHGNKLVQ